MLSLNEIGSIALIIESSGDEPATWPSVVFPGNESELGWCSVFYYRLGNMNKSKNTGYPEGSIFDSLELT